MKTKQKQLVLIISISVLVGLFSSCAAKNTVTVVEDEQNHDIIVEFLSAHYSQRHFADGHISDEIIRQILTAGHRAVSAGNRQPWHFTVIRNRSLIDEIMSDVTMNNVLIVVSGGESPTVEFDSALAFQNMMLAAQALGLGARMYMRPINNLNDNLLPRLDLPENYKAIMILRIGYEADDVDVTTAASQRHPLEDKVNYID